MKKKITFLLMFVLSLSMVSAQGTFRFGTSATPEGKTLLVDSKGLILDGKHIIPVMGEIHYSRVPESEWRREIRKMMSALLGAELTHGSAAVLNAVGFDALLGDTNLVITGEGQLDASSADNGKAVGEVVKRCAANSGGAVPVFIVAGRLGRGYEHIYKLANAGVFSTIVTDEQPNADGDCDAETRLRLASERMFRCIASSFSVNSQHSGRGMRR